MKLSTILPNTLYQRGHMEAYDLPTKQRALAAAGITLAVGLCRRPDPDLDLVCNYIHRELPDGKTIDTFAYERLAGEIVQHVKGGNGAALVHCYGGRNRSGLLNALVVRELLGCSGAEAKRRVVAGRRGALVNPHFSAYLEQLPKP